MNRCHWCQEISELVPIVNRNKTASHDFDWVCPACAEVERSEHADEGLWSPLGFQPSRQLHVFMSSSLDMRLAS